MLNSILFVRHQITHTLSQGTVRYVMICQGSWLLGFVWTFCFCFDLRLLCWHLEFCDFLFLLCSFPPRVSALPVSLSVVCSLYFSCVPCPLWLSTPWPDHGFLPCSVEVLDPSSPGLFCFISLALLFFLDLLGLQVCFCFKFIKIIILKKYIFV